MYKYNTEEIVSADRSPEIEQELLMLNSRIINMPAYFKAEIVISYLKDHCIKNEWVAANPELVKFLLSGNLVTAQIESLFNYCRLKPNYRASFESYIKITLL